MRFIVRYFWRQRKGKTDAWYVCMYLSTELVHTVKKLRPIGSLRIAGKNALKCNETVENSIHLGGCNRSADNKVPFDASKVLTTYEDFGIRNKKKNRQINESTDDQIFVSSCHCFVFYVLVHLVCHIGFMLFLIVQRENEWKPSIVLYV